MGGCKWRRRSFEGDDGEEGGREKSAFASDRGVFID